jgi:hypothetical protein
MNVFYGTISESRLQVSILHTVILLVIAYPLLVNINRKLLSGASKRMISLESCIVGFLIWFGPILGWMNSQYVNNHPGLEYGVFVTAILVGYIYGQVIIHVSLKAFYVSCDSAKKRLKAVLYGTTLLFLAFYLCHIPLIILGMIFSSPAVSVYP